MTRYGQFCPVAKAAEILAERWTILIVRELMCHSVAYNDIARGVPAMSRTLLSKRLKELERAGVVERRPAAGRSSHTYHLTKAGEELCPIVLEIGIWGHRWARFRVDKDDRDPALLMWEMRRALALDRVPEGRTVVHFALSGVAKNARRRFWLLIAPSDAEVCFTDPGFGTDLIISADVRRLIDVWLGDATFAQSVRDGNIHVEGPRRLAEAFPTWLEPTPFAAQGLAGS